MVTFLFVGGRLCVDFVNTELVDAGARVDLLRGFDDLVDWCVRAEVLAAAEAKTLLRDTDLSITEIAFQTGWNSLGTFGRTFRDVTGESPGELRAREKGASHRLDLVPACFLRAAHRPNLTIAVSEKRRQEEDGKNLSEETEVQ